MKRFLVVAALALAACKGTTEPVVPHPYNIVGYYKLVTIDGKALPAALGFSSTVIAGGLTIAQDSGWTVGDTSTFNSGGGGAFFRWGGVVKSSDTLNAYTLRDSTVGGLRYSARFDSVTFTLTGSAGNVYTYQRKP